MPATRGKPTARKWLQRYGSTQVERLYGSTYVEKLTYVPVGACASVADLAPRPDEVADLHELRADIDDVLASLTPKEATIVRRYFGLEGDSDGLTLDEIGQQFGVCMERIRQIKGKALRKLRHPSRRKKLAIYVGIHGDEDFDRFVAAESAERHAAYKAECDAKWQEQQRAWEARRSEQEAQEARRRARIEAQIDKIIRRIGNEVGRCNEWSAHRKREVATALGGVVGETSTEIRSEAELFAYFVALAKHHPTSLSRAYATWMRDVPIRGAVAFTFTRGCMRDGTFVLYARGVDRRTWYLFDMPDGMHWIGYEDMREEMP